MSSCAVEDDDGEKVVFVFVKSGVDRRLMVLSDRVFHGRTKELKFGNLFSCVGACYKVEEGMNLFNFFFFLIINFLGWGMRLWLVVVAVIVADGGSGCWQ